MAQVPIGANAVTLHSLPSTVCLLAEEPSNPEQRLFRGLSDDIFERLRAAFRAAWPHRSMRVVDLQRIGEKAEEGYLDRQWNTSYLMSASLAGDRPPFFHLTHFRDTTNQWMAGTTVCPGRETFGWERPSQGLQVPIQAMFPPEVRIVGMPWIPWGVVWRSLYVDEDTGLVMRAISAIDLPTDEYLLRCDLLCG